MSSINNTTNNYFKWIKKSHSLVNKWVGKVDLNSEINFIKDVIDADNFRFEKSYEWYETETFPYTEKYIFNNSDPKKGLLLFTLCCWMDMQMNYKIVWSKLLEQASNWVDDPINCKTPRGNFSATTSNILKTLEATKKAGDVAQWFSETIMHIVKKNGKSKGNLYRFFGSIMNELLVPSKSLTGAIYRLKSGNLDIVGNWKRAWMFLMFIRRDKNIIKNIFTKSLELTIKGKEAINYWYDNNYFSEMESELPVDARVQNAWIKIFNKSSLSTVDIGYSAHLLAEKYNIPPSSFDAIFFSF